MLRVVILTLSTLLGVFIVAVVVMGILIETGVVEDPDDTEAAAEPAQVEPTTTTTTTTRPPTTTTESPPTVEECLEWERAESNIVYGIGDSLGEMAAVMAVGDADMAHSWYWHARRPARGALLHRLAGRMRPLQPRRSRPSSSRLQRRRGGMGGRRADMPRRLRATRAGLLAAAFVNRRLHRVWYAPIMTKPDAKPGGRWDGWDDPDYEPTPEELEEPIVIPGIENATPEQVAEALMGR